LDTVGDCRAVGPGWIHVAILSHSTGGDGMIELIAMCVLCLAGGVGFIYHVFFREGK